MITKEAVLEALKKVDVKQFELDNEDPKYVKMFRFGNYNAFAIAAELVKSLPENTEVS